MDTVFFSLAARGSETPLNWHTGIEIAIGAEQGLAYLRNNEKIITSSNILLDAYMNAKIADFGLSRLMTSAANSNVIATTTGCLVFTTDDLLCATTEVMGKSTYGALYKATLEDGNQVAVKNLRERIAKCQREFETEGSALENIRDINLLVSWEDQRY